MSNEMLTVMVVGVGLVTLVLLTYLLVQVYRVEDGARLPAKGQKQQLTTGLIFTERRPRVGVFVSAAVSRAATRGGDRRAGADADGTPSARRRCCSSSRCDSRPRRCRAAAPPSSPLDTSPRPARRDWVRGR